MLGLNRMAWVALISWVGIPLLVMVATPLLWRRSSTPLQKSLVTLTSIAVLFGPMLISNGVKWWYDRQVSELCAKDGGVKVYETVKLPAEKFNQWGQVRIPNKNKAKPSDEYYYESAMHYLRNSNPEMWQSHYKVYRQFDNELLGESISYTRRGGDAPGPWHESSFRCPDNSDITDLNKQLFIKAN